MMHRLFLAGGLAVALAAAVMSPDGALAQSAVQQQIFDRIERIERDLLEMQRQTIGGGRPVPTAPGQAQTGVLSPTIAASYEVRLQQIEDEMRGLTGRIEELNYGLSQIRDRLEKLVTDVDLRLQALERRGEPPSGTLTPSASAAPPPSAPARPASPPAPPASGGAPGEPKVLGTLSQTELDRLGRAGAAPAAPPQQASAAVLPGGSPREQYDYAYGLLWKQDYALAERALREFVDKHPEDPLAGNAQYWLGETYYVRKDFAGAAVTFADGYKTYPKSPKASDSLLKLGMSLAQLERTEEACAVLAQLDKQFPNAAQSVKQRAVTEKRRLNCK